MKPHITLILLPIALIACSTKAKEAPATSPTQCLTDKLASLQSADGFAFGHHDDTAYGYEWEFLPDSSDVKTVTGDYPAVMNWDLGLIELGKPEQLDSVPFSFIRDEVRKHAARGGISSFSWHPCNPITGGNSWDTAGGSVVRRAVTDGDSVNVIMRNWIAAAADFVGSLKDDEGHRVPVIFRPWHEHTGDWFWWGRAHCEARDYVALWHLTRQIFDEKGIDNVVWAYSPDQKNVSTREEYLERYPGDEYVDIFGADIYHFNGEDGVDTFRKAVSTTLGIASALAAEKGKIAALTETGCEALQVPDWYTRVLFQAVKDYPIAYVLVWRNANKNKKENHFYVPYHGHPAEADFVKFYRLPQTFFLNDLKNVK